MRRGEVYTARLDPTEGSEQAGARPVIIVSRDSMNADLSTLVVVPCTTYRSGRHVYASQVLIHAPDGGLSNDSIALGEQIRTIAKSRFGRRLGAVSEQSMARIDQALLAALDLPGQP